MQHTIYTFYSKQALSYEFESRGPNGVVKKLVQFRPAGTENIYNLGFGDCDEKTGVIDDLAVTNNRDTQIVLATVAAIACLFTEEYPEALIFATGSTPARTRLYRMGIASNLVEICQDFTIFGYMENDRWEIFQPNCEYEAFLLTRKENELIL